MRKLASVQKILDIQPIEGADAIVVATIQGWKVVVKKDQFKVGDLCVYCEIDSVLPDKPEFEFLRSKKFRIRTIKLRKQISQGIVFSFEDLKLNKSKYKEYDDLTSILEVTKYDPEVEVKVQEYRTHKNPILNKFYYYRYLAVKFYKNLLGLDYKNKPFPEFIPKTEETRIQNLTGALSRNEGVDCYIMEKLEGSSSTIYLNKGKFGVCSRNLDLHKKLNDVRWSFIEKWDIEKRLIEFAKGRNIAIQGELIGPKIQGNIYELKEPKIIFFSLYFIDEQRYATYNEFIEFHYATELEIVPLIDCNFKLTSNIDELVKLSTDKSYLNIKTLREGIVIRSKELINGEIFSCKAISPEYLLKQKD